MTSSEVSRREFMAGSASCAVAAAVPIAAGDGLGKVIRVYMDHTTIRDTVSLISSDSDRAFAEMLFQQNPFIEDMRLL